MSFEWRGKTGSTSCVVIFIDSPDRFAYARGKMRFIRTVSGTVVRSRPPAAGVVPTGVWHDSHFAATIGPITDSQLMIMNCDLGMSRSWAGNRDRKSTRLNSSHGYI